MENAKTAANTELANIDKALRRAAVSAKKQAEQQGTPYVVYRDSSAGQFLKKNNTPSQSKKVTP